MNRRRMLASVIVISGAMAAVAVVMSASMEFSPTEPMQDVPDLQQQTEPTTTKTVDTSVPTKAISDTSYSDPATTSEAIMRHNMFAVDVYRQLAEDMDQKGKNTFFSPFSMYMAFSFVYEGAWGETASQMERVFGFYSNENDRHEHVSRTISSVNRDDPHAILETANSLWINEDYKLYDVYVDTVRTVYSADVESLDFADDPENSAAQINQWAKDKTNDKISKIVDKNDFTYLTVAVLANAVYFKGTWINQFDPSMTQKETFWLDDGSTTKADLMHLKSVFGYAEVDNIQVLEMPYEGDRLSMLVFLPLDRYGLSQLEGVVSAEKIYEWKQQMQPTEVEVTLPKFTAETHYDLVNILSELGMPLAFHNEAANFSGMADISKLPGNLYIKTATQDAFVKVNEEGTEAAAITSVDMFADDSEPYIVPHFTADHPFIFAITDTESGTILFMGRLSNPAA